MKKTLLISALAAVATTAWADDAVWEAVTSNDQIDFNAEYVIGYNELKSPVKNPLTLMSSKPIKDGLTIPGAVSDGIVFDSEAGTITNVPAEAAILKIFPNGDDYSLYVTNTATPGYIGPAPIDQYGREVNGLSISQTAQPIAFTYLTQEENFDPELNIGYATTRIEYTGTETNRNMFTWTKMARFDVPSGTQYFMFMLQAAPGELRLYKKVSQEAPVVGWMATPADKETVEALSSFQIEWLGIEKTAIRDNGALFQATFNGNNVLVDPAGLLSNPMVLNIEKGTLMDEGIFQLKLGEGLLTLTNAAGEEIPSPAITYTLNLTGVPYPEVSFSPADGALFEALDSYKIIFDNVESISVNEPYIAARVNGEDEGSGLISVDGNVATLTFDPAIEVIGDVKMLFPAGTFTINDRRGNTIASEEMTYNCEITGPAPEMPYTLAPAPGEYKVYPTVYLTYENATAIQVPEGATATLTVGSAGTFTLDIVATGANKVSFVPREDISLYVSQYTAYTLNVDKGSYFVTIDGKRWGNQAIEITDYKVAPKTIDFTVSPAQGNYPDGSMFETVVLTVNDEGTLTKDSMKSAKLYLVAEDGTRTQVGNYSGFKTKVEGNTVVLTIASMPESFEDGDYQLELPQGLFKCLFPGTSSPVTSPKTIYYYTIGEPKPAPEQKYTLAPEAGTYQVYPDVVVTYTDAAEVQVPAGATATLKVGDKAEFTLDIIPTENSIKIVPRQDIKIYFNDYTTYSLEVAEGTFSVVLEGRPWPNTALSITDYKVSAPVIEFTVDPEEGTYPDAQIFASFTITIPEDCTISKNTMKTANLYKVAEDGSKEQIGKYSGFKNKVEGSSLVNPITELPADMADGDYQIEIPKGFFKVLMPGQTTPIENSVITLNYTIKQGTVVKTLVENGAEFEVYTIQGVRLGKKDLKELPAGLYIVNGKKHIVR